ncbi:MAG: methyltransferase domain-containing protein, partial [Planctomycetes bacterium]|nr:methyltransferase domain-containing protein [Planctomycetota bacterium]
MHRGVLTLIGAAVCLLVAAGILHVLNAEQTPAEQLAGEILQASGVQGGLIIHLNCGDGQLTAALGASEGYMVHGLDPDPADVIAARAHIKPLSVYGRITVQQHNFDTLGKLPYVENLVNLLVSEEPVSVSQAEILRVLAPNGVAYIGDGANNWTKTVKPRPAEIDDWTHHLYDASNNAVSHDTVIGPPRRMQWVGSPKWARHHDRMSSVSGYVSANGRNFYIVDEGSKVSPQLPAKWSLYARDAFSGVILWSRPIDAWVTSLWPFKAGPTQPARRLVAVGDRVYVTLGLDGTGLSQLDAVTGETLWTYKDVNPSPAWDTVMTEEIIYSDGVLF